MTPREPTRYVCARCGSPIAWWYFGWKHQNGWNSKTRSCGQKPQPMKRADYDHGRNRVGD